MKKILAIDLGTKTAFCWGKNDYAEFNLAKNGKFDPTGYGTITKHLIDLISWVNGPKIVYVEKPHSNTYFASARILFGLMAVVEGYCADAGVPCVLVSPKSIKKFWTGNGNASKDQMLAVGNKLPHYKKVKSDNVMDSIALWHYAQEQENK